MPCISKHIMQALQFLVHAQKSPVLSDLMTNPTLNADAELST